MLKNKIEYFILLLISGFFNLLGLKNSRKFAKYLSYFFYYFVPIRKSTIIDNLKIAFPDWDKKKIKNTAVKNYESFLITLIEILIIPNCTPDEFEKFTYCDNINLIEEELLKKQGLILLTAHFGNWELSLSWLSKKLSHQINALAKAQRNPYVTKLLNKGRETFGNKVVMHGSGVKFLFKCLAKKEIVLLAGDQRGPKESKRVKLFGRETAIYSGTAAIAIKTGVPVIIFGLMCRQPNYIYKYVIEKIEIPIGDESKEEKILQINQVYMNKLEKYIRLYPEQWFWMHKIWKY